jgi:hypothetical protein
MTNARPPQGTGAVVSSRPGSRDTHGTAPRGHIPAALAPESAYVGALLLLDLRTARAALALLLHDLAAGVPVPASVMYYAAAVLDDAVRRRVGEAAARLGQAANGESMASLLELVDREHAAVHELAARRAPAPAPLRAMQ